MFRLSRVRFKLFRPRLVRGAFIAAKPGQGSFCCRDRYLIFALLWLIAPWVPAQCALRSGPSRAHAQPPQASVAKSPGLPPNVTDLASLRKVAEKGDPAAQFSLGARYAYGEEVKQDYTKQCAGSRWRRSRDNPGPGDFGCVLLGRRGVPQDLTKAYYWSVLARPVEIRPANTGLPFSPPA